MGIHRGGYAMNSEGPPSGLRCWGKPRLRIDKYIMGSVCGPDFDYSRVFADCHAPLLTSETRPLESQVAKQLVWHVHSELPVACATPLTSQAHIRAHPSDASPCTRCDGDSARPLAACEAGAAVGPSGGLAEVHEAVGGRGSAQQAQVQPTTQRATNQPMSIPMACDVTPKESKKTRAWLRE